MAKPNRDEEIRKLWAEGVSISLIAQQIGRDRGMVSGRVRRLGLEERVTTARLQPEDKPDDAEIRRLWAEGLTTAEIGRRLGRNKNAIIGRAHRLGLDARPSPIATRLVTDGEIAQMRFLFGRGYRDGTIAKRLGMGVGTATEWRSKLGIALAEDFPVVRRGVRAKAPKPAQPARLKVVAPPTVVIPFRPLNARQCEWIEGDRYPYTKCEGEAAHGTSWCDGHGAFCCRVWPPRQRRAA